MNSDPDTANPWRCEEKLKIGSASHLLRCTMQALATLQAELECNNLIEVYELWQKLDVPAIEKSLYLLSANPSRAKEFWPKVNGAEGLMKVQAKLFSVCSGRTPEDVSREADIKKKLEAILADDPERVTLVLEAIR